MNTIYKVIWNAATQSWVAAPEFFKSRGKKGQQKKSSLALAASIAIAFGAFSGASFAADADEIELCASDATAAQSTCEEAFAPVGAEPKAITPFAWANVGAGNTGVGNDTITVGTGVNINGNDSIGIGSQLTISAANVVAFASNGVTVDANSGGSFLVAPNTNGGVSNSANAVAILGTATNANGGVVIGNGATVSHANAVALGSGSTTSAASTVSVGNATSQRRITNMAAGTADTDAANFGQLKSTAGSVAAALGGGSVGNADGTVSAPSYSVQGGTQNNVGTALSALDSSVSSNTANYNNLNNSIVNGTIGLVQQAANAADIVVGGHRGGTAVDFAGTAGNRVLKGVADGVLSATSTEAVNGSQLFETNTRIDDLIDGSIDIDGVVKYDDASEGTLTLGGASGTVISNVADGELSATSSEAVNGAQLHATNERVQENADTIEKVDARVTNIDGRVTQNTTDITEINNKLENGSIGLVQYDAATGTTTVAGGLGGGVVDFTGQDGVRRLTGLANGTDDTDAVTLAQLKAAGLVDEDGNALGAVVYDDMSLDKVTLGGVNGTVIGNLGNGLIAAGSREAINGGQLWDLKENLEGRLDNLDGRVDIIEKEVADGSGGGGGGGDWDNDAGGKPIHNVGDGVADSDAATVGQVNKKYDEAVKEANGYTDTRFDQLQGEFNDRFEILDDRIDRMAALSGAYAGMAMNTAGLAGKNRVGAGVGAQGGKTALAVGYQRIVGQKNNASVSLGGAFSGSEKSVSAGAGFSW